MKQLLTATLVSTACLTVIILVTQSFRLFTLATSSGSAMRLFFELSLLSVPTFLPLILPLSLAIATMFCYHKLAIDSELVVIRAAGLSPYRQAVPAIALASMGTIFCFMLTLWITPLAYRDLGNLQSNAHKDISAFLATPDVFNDVTPGLTFYVRNRNSKGQLEGILIQDVRNPQTSVTIMADNGYITTNKDNPIIITFQGRRQELDRKTGHISELSFERYVLDLGTLRGATKGRTKTEPREQKTLDLLFPSAHQDTSKAYRHRALAELHQRLTIPWLCLSYTLIGLMAVLMGEFNRRGVGLRILWASGLIILLQAGHLALSNSLSHHAWIAPLLYIFSILPIGVGLILLSSRSFSVLKKLRWRAR